VAEGRGSQYLFLSGKVKGAGQIKLYHSSEKGGWQCGDIPRRARSGGHGEFYSNLFTRQVVLDPGPILACVPERVTAVMNEILAVTFYSRGDTSGGVHDGG